MLMPRVAGAAALLVIAWLATSPNAAQAQTCPTVTATQETVCNINRSNSGNVDIGLVSSNEQAANAFTTGRNELGYMLRSVHIHVTGKVFARGDIEVHIHDDNGGVPSTLRGTLSGPTRPGTGVHEYIGNIALEDRSTYFLRLYSAGPGRYTVGAHNQAAEDGDAGWSIGDGYLEKVGSGNWARAFVTPVSIRFAVVADVILPKGVTANVGELTINESGGANSDEYTLVLSAPPSANVIITPTIEPRGVATLSTTRLTFTAANWDMPQRTTVTAIDDGVGAEFDNPGDQREVTISHTVTSSGDSEYNDIAAPAITVVIIDDDAPEVECPSVPTGQVHACNLDEAAIAAPAFVGYDSDSSIYQQVANAFTTGAAANGYLLHSVRVNFRPIVGSPGNLRVAIHEQSVSTVGATVENGELSGANPPDDGDYEFTASGSGVELNRNTTYYLVLRAPNAQMDGTNGYIAALTSAMQDASDGWSIGDGSLQQQTSRDWVTLFPSNALHFGVLAEPIVAGLTASTDTLAIDEFDEAGAANKGEYTLRLTVQPSANVVVMPTIEPRGVATLSTTRLTFTAANWNDPSTITVTAIDDRIDNPDDPRTATITHAVTGASEYAALTDTELPQVSVTVADDDAPASIPALRLRLRVFLESALP